MMSQDLPTLNNQVCSSTFINIMDQGEKENKTEEGVEMEMEMENRSDQQQQLVIEEDDECLDLSLSICPIMKKMKMSTPTSFPPPNVFSSAASSSSSSQPNNNINLHQAEEGMIDLLNTRNHHQDGPIMHLGPLFPAQSLEPPPPPPPHIPPIRPHVPVIQRAAPRHRRIRSPGLNEDNEVFPPPFPWATDRFAKILTYDEILARGIYEIKGEVQCKKCEHKAMIGFDLKTKFQQIGGFVYQYKYKLSDRAPGHWYQPEFPSCPNCNQPNSLKPVIPDDRKMINWLFLLLGEMIGSCTIDDLRFYCKHTGHHRTGAKNRLLYLTYLGLCNQLDPTGPFEYDPEK